MFEVETSFGENTGKPSSRGMENTHSVDLWVFNAHIGFSELPTAYAVTLRLAPLQMVMLLCIRCLPANVGACPSQVRKKMAYPGANVIVLAFSCLSRDSLNSLREWAAEVHSVVPGFDDFVLVGTHGSDYQIAAAKASSQILEVVSASDVFRVTNVAMRLGSANVRACMAAGRRAEGEGGCDRICRIRPS